MVPIGPNAIVDWQLQCYHRDEARLIQPADAKECEGRKWDSMARLGSRVAFAITGAVVLALVGGVVGARSVLPDGQTDIAAAYTTPTVTASGAAVMPDATTTATVVAPTPTTAQEVTATPQAQLTARPTATPGGVTSMSCTITSINASAGTFTCRNSSGISKIVVTNGQTLFSGAVNSFSGLRTGLRARNTGAYQTDGSFLATRVSTDD